MLRDQDKKMVERPENEPSFDKNNKTDRKLVSMFVVLASVLFVVAVVLVTVYFIWMQ